MTSKKFYVVVRKITYGYTRFDIEADSEAAAKELVEANDFRLAKDSTGVFDEPDSPMYEIETCEEQQ